MHRDYYNYTDSEKLALFETKVSVLSLLCLLSCFVTLVSCIYIPQMQNACTRYNLVSNGRLLKGTEFEMLLLQKMIQVSSIYIWMHVVMATATTTPITTTAFII